MTPTRLIPRSRRSVVASAVAAISPALQAGVIYLPCAGIITRLCYMDIAIGALHRRRCHHRHRRRLLFSCHCPRVTSLLRGRPEESEQQGSPPRASWRPRLASDT